MYFGQKLDSKDSKYIIDSAIRRQKSILLKSWVAELALVAESIVEGCYYNIRREKSFGYSDVKQNIRDNLRYREDMSYFRCFRNLTIYCVYISKYSRDTKEKLAKKIYNLFEEFRPLEDIVNHRRRTTFGEPSICETHTSLIDSSGSSEARSSAEELQTKSCLKSPRVHQEVRDDIDVRKKIRHRNRDGRKQRESYNSRKSFSTVSPDSLMDSDEIPTKHSATCRDARSYTDKVRHSRRHRADKNPTERKYRSHRRSVKSSVFGGIRVVPVGCM